MLTQENLTALGAFADAGAVEETVTADGDSVSGADTGGGDAKPADADTSGGDAQAAGDVSGDSAGAGAGDDFGNMDVSAGDGTGEEDVSGGNGMLYPELDEPILPLAETKDERVGTGDGEDLRKAALTLDGDGYVTGASVSIDSIGTGREGAPEETVENMALYTAIRDDMEFERHGGVYYSGHDVIRYNAETAAVYDAENYRKILDPEQKESAETSGNPDWKTTELVFTVDAMPVTLHPDFVQKQELSDGSILSLAPPNAGKALYAWEYEASGSGNDIVYKKINEHEITAAEYVFTEERTGENGLQKISLTAAVKLDGSWMKSTANPVAIVAKLYDAKQSGKENFYWSTWQGDALGNGMVFAPDFFSVWNRDLNYYICQWVDVQYEPGTKFYMDDAFTKEALGSFDLRAYDYWVDEDAGTITLLDAAPYNFFVFARAGRNSAFHGMTRRGEGYDYTLPAWVIPATYDLRGKTYNIFLEGGNDGKVPADAKSLTVKAGVGYPKDAYGLFGHGTGDLVSYWYKNTFSGDWIYEYAYPILSCPLRSITIEGSGAASVGSNIENMFGMFNAGSGSTAPKTYDITALNTSNAVSMRGMFTGNIFAETPDLSSFNTAKVSDMTGMFANCQAAQGATIDVHSFDTRNVETMYTMFSQVTIPTGSTLDLSMLDTGNVIDMGNMFTGASFPSGSALKLNGKFDTSKVQSMKYMFSGMKTGDGSAVDLSNFRTGAVEDMESMFDGTGMQSVDLTTFDFGSVKNMKRMFAMSSLAKITLPENMDSTKATDMSFLFMGDENLTEIVHFTAMDTDSARTIMGMFAPELMVRVVDYSHASGQIWAIRQGKSGVGKEAPKLKELDLTNFRTENVLDARMAFYDPNVERIRLGEGFHFKKLRTLDVYQYHTPVSPVSGMFGLSSVTELDLGNVRFEGLDNAEGLFDGLGALEELTLAGIDFSDVTNGGALYFDTPKLKAIDLSEVKLGAYSLDQNSFKGTPLLEELTLPKDMPALGTSADLPQELFDEDGNTYTRITGGYGKKLHLVSALGDPVDELRIPWMKKDIFMNLTGGNSPTEVIQAYFYYQNTPYYRGIAPMPEITWAVEQDGEVISYENVTEYGEYNTNDTIEIKGLKEGTAKITVTAKTENGTFRDTCQVTVVGEKTYQTTVTASDGSVYFVWKMADGNYMLTGMDSLATTKIDLTAIDSVTCPITKIAAHAFDRGYTYSEGGPLAESEYREDGRYAKLGAVTEIIISKDVEEIGGYAFDGLRNVEKLSFEEGSRLRVIGDQAFYNMGRDLAAADDETARVTVNPLPEGLSQIGRYAFANSYIREIALTGTATQIGEGCFSDCCYLEKATLPTGMDRIPEKLFSGCHRLKEIGNLAAAVSGVSSIGASAFNSVGSNVDEGWVLVDLTADNCKWIGASAFSNCALLQSFSGPQVTSMGTGAFGMNGKHLKEVSFPRLAVIPENAFIYDWALTKVGIPSAVTIGDNAFNLSDSGSRSWALTRPDSFEPVNLVDFTIPESVTWIGESAFAYVDAPLVISAGVTYIGDHAFYACYGLREVTIPESVSTLGANVFSYCENLTSVKIDANLTRIPEGSFYKCSNLTDVVLADCVQEIGGGTYKNGAFAYCRLTSLKLPAGLKTIEEGAFKNAIFGSRKYTTAADGSVTDVDGLRVLEIPYGTESIGMSNNNAYDTISPVSGYEDNGGQYHDYYDCSVEELWLPETLTGMKLSICGYSGALLHSSEETIDGEQVWVPYGTLYFGKDRDALLALVGDAEMERLEEYNFEIHYNTGWTNRDGELVFQYEGKTATSGLRRIGGYWYLLDEEGKALTGTAMIKDGYVYCFDASGRGERVQYSADGVYAFFDGGTHVLVKEGTVVEGESSEVSLSGMIAYGGAAYFAYPDGTLARGFVADTAGNGFYFDDYEAKDCRLVWYHDAGTGRYYAGASTEAALLDGSYPDENGAVIAYTEGRKSAIQTEDLVLSVTPSAAKLYINGDASETSDIHPLSGTMTVSSKMQIRNISWEIVSNAPRFKGNQVLVEGSTSETMIAGDTFRFTANAAGSARIRATVEDAAGNTAYIEQVIQVLELANVPKSVTVSAAGNAQTIQPKGTLQMSATVLPADVSDDYKKVTWTVSWPNNIPPWYENYSDFASIDQNGLLKINVSRGALTDYGVDSVVLTVTATTKNIVKGTYKVTVIAKEQGEEPGPDPEPDPEPTEIAVTGVVLNQTVAQLYPGESLKLSATVSPANAADKSVSFAVDDASEDPTAVSVDESGKVTALHAGKAVVTVTANGAADGKVQAQCTITVLESEVAETDENGNPIDPGVISTLLEEAKEDGKISGSADCKTPITTQEMP